MTKTTQEADDAMTLERALAELDDVAIEEQMRADITQQMTQAWEIMQLEDTIALCNAELARRAAGESQELDGQTPEDDSE